MESRNKLTMCRLCLCESECFINIFERNDWQGYVAAEVINDLFQFQVSEMDGYPHVICSTCLTKLTEFKQFKEFCQKSKLTYDNMFISNESLVDHEPETMVYVKKEEDCLENTHRLADNGSDLESGGQYNSDICYRFDTNSHEWVKMDSELEIHHCKGCQRVFHSENTLKLHSENCQETCIHCCKYCEEVFPSLIELNRHEYQFHPPDKCYPCKRCLKRFNSREQLVKHLTKCDFQCTPGESSDVMCDDSETMAVRHSDTSEYLVESELKSEEISIGGESDECDYNKQECSMAPKTDLETNITNDKPYRCDACGGICESRKELILHIKESHSSKKPNICGVCNTGFTSRLILGMHQVIHDKQFTCVVCGREFLTEISYKKHTKICLENRVTYRCQICSVECWSKGNLNSHMDVHSDEKKFACPHCPKKYKSKSMMRKHFRAIHLNIKPHECSICRKRFAQRANLLQHHSIHLGSMPFKCINCEKCFKTRSKLYGHQKIEHVKSLNADQVNVTIHSL